jgi:hypothetical protein
MGGPGRQRGPGRIINSAKVARRPASRYPRIARFAYSIDYIAYF